MASSIRPRGARGFSLVEMLVALLFTGLLMAGMAQVFKTSLTAFYTSSESLSSSRRNRMSMDLLYDDLNSAGMYLTSLSAPPPGLTSANPAFYIIPNQPVSGAGGGADDPATADELYFYVDQPLWFEGTLSTAGNSAATIIAGTGLPTATDSTFTVDCGDASYASLLKTGQYMITKDSWETLYIASVTTSGKIATITVGGSAASGVTGLGSAGSPSRFQHITGSRVMFYTPGQVLRYSLKMKALDPDPQAQNPSGLPCLVRDQGTYSPTGFVADPAQESVVADNVQAFKVYLSADAGNTWAGHGKDYAGFDLGWTSGIRADLNSQVAAIGRADVTTTQGNESWFRKIPTLVRLDVTTRTAIKRPEYSTTPTTAAYKLATQSIVMVPRHFGLPIN